MLGPKRLELRLIFVFGTLGGGASFGTLRCFAGVFRRRPLIGLPPDLERCFIASAVAGLRASLKAKCGGARFNPLVHHARSGDDNSVHEVALSVTSALNARSAGPDCSSSRHKLVDEFSERFERIDLCGIRSTLPHKVDATAAQKDENLQSRRNAAICDSKADSARL